LFKRWRINGASTSHNPSEIWKPPVVGLEEVKRKLARALNAALDPLRERRADVLARPGRVREILMEGSLRARRIAQETMKQVREAVGLAYGA